MDSLVRQFERIGARVKVGEFVPRGSEAGSVRFDVKHDERGEFFDLRLRGEPGIQIVNVRADLRHLLVHADTPEGAFKFLCGHDERHWFVAAVPREGVTTVAAAMRRLQPEEVRVATQHIRPKDRTTRRNGAYLRQGEWFFLPCPGRNFDPSHVRHDEPLQRGPRSKPHRAQDAVTSKGRLVYVRGTTVYTEGAFATLPETERRNRGWTQRIADAEVYVRGRITHPDHATVDLGDVWHLVRMNREAAAPGRESVAFLD